MDYTDKVNELKSIIRREISPLVTNDYVLWGLPYYPNIGDTLIWEGELEFLKSIPYKCLGTCGWDEYEQNPLDESVVILITGGGYMGDVWRTAWDNVMDTIEHYPNNPIVILPNTIFYDSPEIMRSDAERLSQLKRLTICVRDNISYQTAKEHFRNEVRLVPDMAFCISLSYLEKWRVSETDRVLFLKRIDKELGNAQISINEDNVDVRDWPTMDGMATLGERIFYKSRALCSKANNHLAWLHPFAQWLEHKLGYYVYRKSMTSRGVKFVSAYKKIYTTRLHVMILSVLLGKKVYFIDNSYGKLSSFYNTWLKDCTNVNGYTN